MLDTAAGYVSTSLEPFTAGGATERESADDAVDAGVVPRAVYAVVGGAVEEVCPVVAIGADVVDTEA